MKQKIHRITLVILFLLVFTFNLQAFAYPPHQEYVNMGGEWGWADFNFPLPSGKVLNNTWLQLNVQPYVTHVSHCEPNQTITLTGYIRMLENNNCSRIENWVWIPHTSVDTFKTGTIDVNMSSGTHAIQVHFYGYEVFYNTNGSWYWFEFTSDSTFPDWEYFHFIFQTKIDTANPIDLMPIVRFYHQERPCFDGERPVVYWPIGYGIEGHPRPAFTVPEFPFGTISALLVSLIAYAYLKK